VNVKGVVVFVFDLSSFELADVFLTIRFLPTCLINSCSKETRTYFIH
jgi:hypothetical protein